MRDDNDPEMKRIREKKMKEMTYKPAHESKPAVITDATFKETITNHPAVVLDCWAPWCGPCRMISPIVDEMAQEYGERIFFGKLNVDENPDVTCEFQIMSIPTLLVFKDGKLVERIVGAMPKPMLTEKINRCIC